jgi:hypothetical protein
MSALLVTINLAGCLMKILVTCIPEVHFRFLTHPLFDFQIFLHPLGLKSKTKYAINSTSIQPISKECSSRANVQMCPC